ncbi:uncharacterized protein LOC123559393 [Mercenaria mercenaria]|uniref:uncharacterized protein LOC123559393 n=1 Tax=Mercenaria mercenaria TaxID=6596 RepID=UPI001E1D6069|nr:uncharacterized protein LOC123559393 [Mercenaria mercenaria]
MSVMQKGHFIGEDLRKLVLKKIVSAGGDAEMATVPRGIFASVAKQLEIHHTTVKNIWTTYCVNKTTKRKEYKRYNNGKLHADHKQYIDYLVRCEPSISLGSIRDKLIENCDLQISTKSISNYLKKVVSRKILTRPAADRYKDDNMIYMQAFLDVLHTKDVKTIKFFDESGFAKPDVNSARYGRSAVGERAIETQDRQKTPNKTFNLLIGVQGVCYANILPGASTTDTYIDFFFKAVNATTNDGYFALKPGDIVVVDNCPIHHHRGEDVLAPFLDMLGIEYIFLPRYSPNLNPIELCFQHIKTLFKTELVRALAKDNLEYAIMHCVNGITAANCYAYYQHANYMQI